MPAAEGALRWDVRASVDERRDQILRSLASFVRDRRLASLTMRDIADRLGLVKGNLYYYFKNKQDILYHCHVKCIAISLAALDEVCARTLPPAEALRGLLVRHIRNITEDAYGGVLLTDLESLTPSQRKRYVAMRDRFEHGVRKMIRGGIAEGDVRDSRTSILAGFTRPWRDQLDPEMVPARRAASPVEIAENRGSTHPVACVHEFAAPLLKLGEEFEGPSKTLTDAHFLLFSGLTGDVHPIHYDVEYAKQTRFGKPLAHGLLHGRHDCAWRLQRPRAHRRFCVRRTGLPLSQAQPLSATRSIPASSSKKSGRKASATFAGSRRQLTNQRSETLLEGFHLYRVLRHDTAEGEELMPQIREPVTGGKALVVALHLRAGASHRQHGLARPARREPTIMARSPRRATLSSRPGRSSGNLRSC